MKKIIINSLIGFLLILYFIKNPIDNFVINFTKSLFEYISFSILS